MLADLQSENADLLEGMFYDWELDKLLGNLADEAIDPYAEWNGMPEYESEDDHPAYAIKINFRSLEDLQDFARLIGQSLTEKTRSLWYPIKLPEKTKDISWVSNES